MEEGNKVEVRLRDGRDYAPARSQGLVDVLDRILDKGLVVAGDIRVRLADVELLTIQIRLLVCSVDKAEEIGLDWWKDHSYLTRGERGRADGEALEELSRKLDRLADRVGEWETRKTREKG